MLERIKRLPLIRSLYQFRGLFSAYHFMFSFLGALIYGFPSKKLTVIGVTGTKGKTTTCNLIAQILGANGYTTGMATTVNFRIGGKEWVNDTKQTMLGRIALQRLLRDMVRAGCRYAIIETSSEGIVQHRHRFINYHTAVFTNLSKEHIERHGSFERYRDAKVRLFEQVARRRHGIGVYNLDDENVHYFLEPNVAKKYGFTLEEDGGSAGLAITSAEEEELERTHIVKRLGVSNVRLSSEGSEFAMGGERFAMPLIGEANVYNAAAAIAVAIAEHVPTAKIRDAIAHAHSAPGRLEIIKQGQGFTVLVDYAHEPVSLESVYTTAKLFNPKRMIGLLGSQGGGRDTWKRAAMGKVAGDYCDAVVLANEDPYDEDPMKIIDAVARGVLEGSKRPEVYKIIDRREAIRKALSLARPGDAVILTGKGGEVWMCIAGGKKVAWDEKRIVEEELKKLSGK